MSGKLHGSMLLLDGWRLSCRVWGVVGGQAAPVGDVCLLGCGGVLLRVVNWRLGSRGHQLTSVVARVGLCGSWMDWF